MQISSISPFIFIIEFYASSKFMINYIIPIPYNNYSKELFSYVLLQLFVACSNVKAPINSLPD